MSNRDGDALYDLAAAGGYDDYTDTDDYRVGQAAVLLQQKGRVAAAALMLDVQALDRDYVPSWAYVEETGIRLVLEVEPYLIERFTEDRLREILECFREIFDGNGDDLIESMRVRPAKPTVGPDWRKDLSAAMTADVNNQARRSRLEPHPPHEDNLTFANEWEAGVYRVLKAKQAALPTNATIGIYPLPGGRLPGRTLEPDFLITYKGRAGIIEVDGPHHTGPTKRSSDTSRDARFRAAGVAFVDRLDVRDVSSVEEVVAFVDAFLDRMLDHR